MDFIEARELSFSQLNETIRRAGKECRICACQGQRFIAAGMSGKTLVIDGVPGNALGAYLGGGSITALPIIETQAGDISAYIPTNVISITDGQIFLETELFHSGVMPAVNPGVSVSRVGGNAQIKAMKKVAGTLKLIYSQYRELASFAQFGSDLDADTKARLEQGVRIVEVLKQNQNVPVPVEKQVAILYAVTKGILSKVAAEDVRAYEDGLYTWLDTDAEGAAVMQEISATGKLEADTEEKLKSALESYTENFINTRPAK